MNLGFRSVKLDQVLLRQSARFDDLDAQNQRIISALSDSYRGNLSTSSSGNLREQMEALTQLVARLGTITNGQDETIQAFKVTTEEEVSHRRHVQGMLLKGLRYPTMTDRYEQVSAAYQQTFSWIFSPSTNEQVPWSNFVDWLEHGSGVYWINDKAGSGKSTLMKYIYNNSFAQKALTSWAGSTPMCS